MSVNKYQMFLKTVECGSFSKAAEEMNFTQSAVSHAVQALENELGVPLTVFLVNGFQMRGSVTGFDSFTVVLLSEGRQQMIYKHAISTIAPLSPIDLHEADETGEE